MGGFQGLLETCFFVKSFVWGTNALRDVYVWQICIQHMHGILNTQTLHILPQISERVYHICSWSFPWNSHWPKIQAFFVTFWHSFHMSSLISHHKVVVSKTFDGFVGSFTLEEDDSWLLIIFWMGGANYLSWERNFWFSKFFFSRQVEVFIIYTPLNISKRIPQMKCSVILGIYVMLNFGT